MSETAGLGALLAAAGGFMDAYSYVCRGKVFANAQTGNVLLLGVNLAEKNWSAALRYAAPVAAFLVGIAAAEWIRFALRGEGREKSLLHWRQLCVLLEALLLAAVCFIPQSLNLMANSVTSMACGIQVESFRKIHGNGIATTMCIGNLRSGTESFCRFLQGGGREALKTAVLYFGIIICFIVGAVLGNYVVATLAERALLVCSAMQLAAFFIMFKNPGSVGKVK